VTVLHAPQVSKAAGVADAKGARRLNLLLTVLYVALTFLYLALTVLNLAMTVLNLALTVLNLALTVLNLALTVLHVAQVSKAAGVADAKGARRLNLLLADMHRKNGRSQVRMNS